MRFCYKARRFIDDGGSPHAAALIDNEQHLSWEELAAHCDLAVQTLQAAPAGVPVIIHGHQQVDSIVWQLACLTQNHPFVPVKSNTPAIQLARIEQQLGIGLRVDIARNRVQQFQHGKPMPLGKQALACLIFSAGSTGEPKDATVSQKALSAFSQRLQTVPLCSTQPTYLNLTLRSFEDSLLTVVSALSRGGQLILTENQTAASLEASRQHSANFSCQI